jgi:hypothetical protein
LSLLSLLCLHLFYAYLQSVVFALDLKPWLIIKNILYKIFYCRLCRLRCRLCRLFIKNIYSTNFNKLYIYLYCRFRCRICRFFVDFLLKVFILQSLANYIFIFIVEFGVDFGVEKSVDFVDFFKKSTLNLGYSMG